MKPSLESTISRLMPGRFVDLTFSRVTTGARHQGSLRQQLPRPSRQPEYGRPWSEGDPVNLIDWKAFARSDQMLVRLQRPEISSRINIYVDGRESMHWPDQSSSETLPTKFELALRASLSAAHMHMKSGDQVRWILVLNESEKREFLFQQADDLLQMASELERHNWQLEETLNLLVPYHPKDCQMVYRFSDGFADKGEWGQNATYARFIHVLSSLECQTEWLQDDVSYYGETETRQDILGKTILELYEEKFANWRQALQQSTQASGGDYMLINDATKLTSWFSFMTKGAEV